MSQAAFKRGPGELINADFVSGFGGSPDVKDVIRIFAIETWRGHGLVR
jgi:hypothetical protein